MTTYEKMVLLNTQTYTPRERKIIQDRLRNFQGPRGWVGLVPKGAPFLRGLPKGQAQTILVECE